MAVCRTIFEPAWQRASRYTARLATNFKFRLPRPRDRNYACSYAGFGKTAGSKRHQIPPAATPHIEQGFKLQLVGLTSDEKGGSTLHGNQQKKPSEFGRMYYEGVSVQNVNKELRRAMLGNCWEYDIRSSVIAWKMGFAQQYLTSESLDGDIRRNFPATLNYLEDKADFMRTVCLYVFDDRSKGAGEFHMKLLKQAFTAISFGARLASTGWQDGSGHWNNPALVNILKNTQERNRFFNDRSVRAFIKEQNTLDDFLFKQFKTHQPKLVKLPCLLTHSGRLSKAKVLAYLYQHGETQVMDIVCATAAANERKPIANVHDAIFFKRRLGAELKAEIEWQMRSQTGNPYWHLTAKELKRYEPRHFDVIAEETAHKRRMAAEHAAALHYVPAGIAQMDMSPA